MSRGFSLMALLMSMAVVVYGRDNIRGETRKEATMDDDAQIMRTVSEQNQLCGRILATGWPGVGEEDARDGESDSLDKILGSSYVVYGHVPWHVNILVNGLHRCGGVIINEFWVLTSAFCVDNNYINENLITLVVGDESILNEDPAQQTYVVSRVVKHRFYRSKTRNNNIALLLVRDTNRRGIQFNSYVQPICLPENDERPHDGDLLTVTGWGDYSHSGYTDELGIADLQVMNLGECRMLFDDGMITAQTICLDGTVGGHNAALRDYGGPATRSQGGINVLHGIISTANTCTQPCPVVVLTRVQYFRDWIIQTIQRFSHNYQKVIPPRSDSSIRYAAVEPH